MRRRSPEEIVTPDQVILPDQAVEVNPLSVADELENFMAHPNTFSVEPLIKKLVSEAYPDHDDAPSFFMGSFSSGRRIEDEVSKFPVFPLSKMKDFDKVLVDLVLDWSYPEPKYSFGPQNQLHELIVRSDSDFAHNALVSHITLPFPRGHRTVWDGPDEMQYKSRIVGELFSAATYHGTPDINPLATRSLVEVYESTRPGGFTYEWAKDKEVGMAEDEKTQRGFGPSTDNLRDLQDSMLARFISYPHESFDRVVLETLESEPVDEKRLFTVMNALVRGRLRKRDDSYYADIADKVIAPYDSQVAELFKERLSHYWLRGAEVQARHVEISRALSRRIIAVELEHNADNKDLNPYRSYGLLNFAVSIHPLDSLHLEFGAGTSKKSEWVKSPNYYEDLSYLLGLIKGPDIDGVRSRAAWHITQSFEHDYAYDDKPQRAKATYMAMADAALSTQPLEYEAIIENGADGVIDAMSQILHKVPLAMDQMKDDDIVRLMTYRAAYNQYINELYPGGAGYRPPQGSSSEVWEEFHRARRLHDDFEHMANQFGERLRWQEIQTNPRRYAEYLLGSTRNFSDSFNWDVERAGKYARGEQHHFNADMKTQTMKAESIFRRSEAGENVEEDLVRFVADCAKLQAKYSYTDLRYNNQFHLEFSRFLHGIKDNLPLKMKGIALKLIESGQITDFIRDDDKARIKKKLIRAKITV